MREILEVEDVLHLKILYRNQCTSAEWVNFPRRDCFVLYN